MMGNQSSGKSSVFEFLSRVPFPRGTGLVTRCATQYVTAPTLLRVQFYSCSPAPASVNCRESIRARCLSVSRADIEVIFNLRLVRRILKNTRYRCASSCLTLHGEHTPPPTVPFRYQAVRGTGARHLLPLQGRAPMEPAAARRGQAHPINPWWTWQTRLSGSPRQRSVMAPLPITRRSWKSRRPMCQTLPSSTCPAWCVPPPRVRQRPSSSQRMSSCSGT